jgi:hypothetical protein
MKLQGEISISGRNYTRGSDVPWYRVYPFFIVHMLAFGGSGFLMAYSTNPAPLSFLYLHGGIAIAVYTIFYLTLFGRDDVKWMFINAGLGVLGIYGQMGWLLSTFGKNIEAYSLSRSVIPFLYFVLYTFLLRHALLDLTGAREDEEKKKKVEYSYVVTSVLVSLLLYYLYHRQPHATLSL